VQEPLHNPPDDSIDLYRTETMFQDLFKMEAKLATALAEISTSDDDTKDFQNLKDIRGHLRTRQDMTLTHNRLGDGTSVIVPVKDLDYKVPFWVMYNMLYELRLDFSGHGPSRVLAAGGRQFYSTRFYPFQRPFYTDIEAHVDNMLLEYNYDRAFKMHNSTPRKGSLRIIKAAAAFVSKAIPRSAAQRQKGVVAPPTRDHDGDIVLNHLSAILLAATNETPFTADNAICHSWVSSTAPSMLAHATVWQHACEGKPVLIGNTQVQNPSFVSIDSRGQLTEIPAATSSSSAGAGFTINNIPSHLAIRRLSQRPVNSATSPFRTILGLPGAPQLEHGVRDANPGNVVPPGFILSGDINVFGKLPGKLYTFQGTASDGGVHEIVTLANDTTLGALLSGLDEVDIAGIQLKTLQLEYTDGVTTPSHKIPGLWFEADVALGGILQPVSDILKSIFNQSDPELHAECFLGYDRDWTQLETPTGITMRGTYDGISVKLGDHLELTNCGVNISIVSEVDDDPTYREFHSLHYEFTGKGLFNVPGSVAPLAVNLTLTKEDQLITLLIDLDDSDWDDAFGIRGLTVRIFAINCTILHEHTQTNQRTAVGFPDSSSV